MEPTPTSFQAIVRSATVTPEANTPSQTPKPPEATTATPILPTNTPVPPTVTAAPPPFTATPTPATPVRSTEAICAHSVVPSSLRTGNLLPNPSFEDGDAGWVRVRIDGVIFQAVLDSTVARTGMCSVRLSRQVAGECSPICGYWNSAPIPVDPSRTYRVSVWFKGSSSLAGSAAFATTFRALDAAGGTISHGGYVQGITGEWKETLLPTYRPPANAASLIIDLAWTGSVRQDLVEGEIWIDDVFFGLLP